MKASNIVMIALGGLVACTTLVACKDKAGAQTARQGMAPSSGRGEPIREIPRPTTYQLLALHRPLLISNLHPKGARGQEGQWLC